jgi:DNA-binding MarR family transcriptional regulator
MKRTSPSSDDAAARRLATLQKIRIVLRAAQQHSAWVEKQCGVSGAQLWLMAELAEQGGMRVGALARTLAIHQTTTSNLLDELVKRALVSKQRDPDDQRAVLVSLTAAGAALLAAAPKPARGLLATALRQMPPAQLAQLDQGLQQLLDAIGALDEDSGLLPLPFMM